ncbi:NUDIX hydrolase [Virgibacillus litoralis]|uniref:8-oxo-dGTP diphosphatase n=1 Tax=Virgibacillus litoralis TaxID=578221 RepID=A0ABS4HFK6_9BACI|nr:8-oxo-dGTP diphosphatase [Virgibacillus litoralis]MBP1949707.1 8-oxo-dGTP diphosphatase [Virgibacillus litoralis]
MLDYTICFIKRGDEILLLNRESPAWMGMWNGVGGKVEDNETALDGILREINEETGINEPKNIMYKGNVCWEKDGKDLGGMYVFIAELPESYNYTTPKSTDEGTLDWKKLSWVLHDENLGVIENIKYFLPKMLDEQNTYSYRFVYKDTEIIDVISEPLEQYVK